MTFENKNRTSGALIGFSNGRVDDEFSARTSFVADSMEEIFFSTNKDFYICQVLSGFTMPAKTKKKIPVSLYNSAFATDIGDGKPRWTVRIRDITSKYFNKGLSDFTDGIPNPDLYETVQEKEMMIGYHPIAYTPDLSVLPNYGSIVVVRRIGNDYFIDTSINPTSGFAPGSAPLKPYTPGQLDFSMGDVDINSIGDTGVSALAKKYGVAPLKRTYNGIHPVWNGKVVENGLPHPYNTLLRTPDNPYNEATKMGNWKVAGASTGALLIDYIQSFNAIAAAWRQKFNEPLVCSGIRNFKNQIKVRKGSIASKEGGNVNCTTYTQPGSPGKGCGTARPGTSNHGWGQAIDIRIFSTKWHGVDRKKRVGKGWWTGKARFITEKHPGYKWLVENVKTGKVSLGMKWRRIPKEPWHWEPVNKAI